jgi:hypothetical protein
MAMPLLIVVLALGRGLIFGDTLSIDSPARTMWAAMAIAGLVATVLGPVFGLIGVIFTRGRQGAAWHALAVSVVWAWVGLVLNGGLLLGSHWVQ